MMDNTTKIITIETGITSKQQLFDVYNEKLNFPSYFGNNWDAFYDCLVNVPGKILIIHEDMPLVNFENDLKIYLDTLKDILSLAPDSIKIIFQKRFKGLRHTTFNGQEAWELEGDY